MKKLHKTYLTGLAASVSMAAMLAGTSAYAQDAEDCDRDEDGECVADGVFNNDPDDEVTVDDTGATGTDTDQQIIVTGSRVRRDTYSSISPLQVTTTEIQRDVGNFDAAQILQQSESAAGQQIDATFQGFVLDNGPGSQTLNLRGLGPERTLLLINGRRLAPAGVEGAPTSPSINLLPTSLIQRYDLLLDGASSVYGSDAVAGVGNVVLRTDIDGFELFASGNINPDGGGDDYTISGAWGTTFDRGFFGIGVEYAKRDEVQLRDRPFLAGCDTNYEIDQNGNILTVDVADNAAVLEASGGAVQVREDACKIGGISGRIFNPFNFSGSIYFQADGQGNFPGFPDFPFADSTDAAGNELDFNNDGIRDVDFRDVNTNGANLDQTFISEQDLYNVMAFGEYSLGGDANLTPFFEVLYSRAEISSPNTGVPQLFPSVPDLNPFNPCNIDTNPDGVDCRLIDNAINNTIIYSPTGGNNGARFSGFSLPVQPITAIRGDRNNSEVTQEQYRGVLGLRGDLPFIGDTWSFEASGVYSRSEGVSVRRGIREDRLALSLGLDPTADYNGDGVVDNNGDGIADDYDNGVNVFGAFGDPLFVGVCNTGALANPDLAAPDLTQGCVPVNLFAPSALTGAIGDLETQAERDYLFDTRRVDTTYEQIVLSAYATGDLIELPAGPVALVLGAEFREDSISTTPNFQAVNGLFFGFFRDLGTNGSKYIIEGFGELDVPVFDNDEFGRLDLNLSGRLSEEEFYGTAFTYSLKGGYRPVPQVLFKASYGTSFRAPNLRENFLGGITGFTTVTDPCAVPGVAFQPLNGGYQANLDPRDQTILDICVREGRDPTSVGINAGGTNTATGSSIEVAQTGSLLLEPETSRSFTTGVAISEGFGAFDLSFNFNYYSIIVEDSIAGVSAQFSVNECYNADRPIGDRSVFCDQLSYSPGERQLINQAFPFFINQDKETVRGIDLNASLGWETPLAGDTLDLGLTLQANHLIERSTLFLIDPDNPDFEDNTGEFGFPLWTGRAIFSAALSDFVFTWQTRWIGETEQAAAGIDPLSDAFGNGPDGNPTGFLADTCTGGGSPSGVVEGDGVFCRDVGFADDYFVHTLSLRYDFNDDITLRAGITNVFDEAPPLIDTNEVFGISNTPIGNGYDLNGREFFGSISVRF
ncbi:TonB-dependent receptor domain-containing protein [Aurantiacibacter gangjinensis]|uniref:TonB-dependent receptor n=1 Tax=Aurantiacibacter gangjinensis TaxID=502682 RepID=A0A0G9MSE7_9SPHN|nr:TonB-dependent receptor [Aurantiacibacter gangjinensis]APE27077.1 TonB-dependent receptor [Aurantiacibacter gangjinensis]KLE33499.1 TonB-dependent receptor [Aurantiacibacter gangjinensis]